MSRENEARLLHAAGRDDQLRGRRQNATDLENVIEIADESGVEVGELQAEQAHHFHAALSGAKPLTTEALKSFAGGIVLDLRPPGIPQRTSF